MFQKLIRIVEVNNSLNEPKRKERRLALPYSKKLSPLLKGIMSKKQW